MSRFLAALPGLGIAVSTSVLLLYSSQLQRPSRIAKYPQRPIAHHPLHRYQAGYVFSRNQGHSAIWVENTDTSKRTSFAQVIEIPDHFRVDVGDVAVSFDGEIAVVADATDKEGRLVSVIAWLNPDGSLARVVHTSPFAAVDIGFTADGSLWAVGIEKIDKNTAHPSHDILRQYGPNGALVRTLLPHSGFWNNSQDYWHAAYSCLLVTSRNYVAFISREASSRTLISTAGVIMSHGALEVEGDLEIVSGAVTDSGLLFIQGQWSIDPRLRLHEVARNGELKLVETTRYRPENTLGFLLGSERESLVFLRRSSNQGPEIVWSSVH